ncbi:MAG: DUF6596 domain-containing protein [Pseudomonadota bacterium]
MDGWRRAATAKTAETHLAMLEEELRTEEAGTDRRLELLFVCAHPAIDLSIHAPLMLQTVLGARAEEIAPLWLSSPPAMAQRLVRAKRKIAEARIAFEIPEGVERSERLGPVLDAIYAALTLEGEARGLAAEAEYLAALVTKAFPEEPEAAGLFALCLYAQATAAVESEAFVPLSERDVASWDRERILRAEELLRRAAARRQPGRFQLEAAIRSAHVIGRLEQRDTGEVVVQLYRRLLQLAPSIGARCGLVAALLEAGNHDEAERELAAIAPQGDSYQPFWVVQAQLAVARGDAEAAENAYDKAVALTPDEPLRAFLLKQKDRCRRSD